MTRLISITCLAIALILFSTGTLSAQAGKSVTIVDPNVVAEADLAKLPHMNAAIAKALVGGRPFLSMTALDTFLQAQKLTRAQLTELYGRLFLHLNLNSASSEEIQLIPGLGARMLREFKEYRTYKAMEQFRREMGKYVSKEEVARLERYVAIN